MSNLNKKGFLSLPILFLVLLEICLIMFTLFYFNSKHTVIERRIILSSEIDSVYFNEAQLNFVVQNILDKSIINASFTKEDFIREFKKELYKYNDSNGNYFVPGLNQVEAQVVPSNIDLGDNHASIVLNFVIDNSAESDSSLKVSYSYTKKFEKFFNSS